MYRFFRTLSIPGDFVTFSIVFLVALVGDALGVPQFCAFRWWWSERENIRTYILIDDQRNVLLFPSVM